ncbi:T9SS type A sorting domain-containing protein [bacterium]|nr:T9SS type A sorting domain-containing protein [bacterium]
MKNYCLLTFIILSALFTSSLMTTDAYALINNYKSLVVESGETVFLSGVVYKSVSIHVKNGGEVKIIPYDGSGVNKGALNLISPRIRIDGVIKGEGVCYNETGKGQPPSKLLFGGGGGAGYGGAGGRGGGSYYGAGGLIYDSYYKGYTGSYGWRANYDTQYSGYGGGYIRLDAMTLTITSSAELLARANTFKYDTVGGGSGGCVLINSIFTLLNGSFKLDVSGGEGGGKDDPIKEAGGGGGGRIKIIRHTVVGGTSGEYIINGGKNGGGSSEAGDMGTILVANAPLPDPPELLSPDNGQKVGYKPTLTFQTTDPAGSKFLKYQIILRLNSSTGPIAVTATQMDPDAGWEGKDYFQSGEQASYSFQENLVTSETYYWSVSVTSNNGADWVSAFTYRSFTISDSPNDPPLSPQQLFPGNDQINVSCVPGLDIMGADPDGDTLTCMILLSKDSQLSNPKIFQSTYDGWDEERYLPSGAYAGITACCQILNSEPNLDVLVPGTDYYWRVWIYDHLQQSRSSGTYHFTTVDRPAIPAIVSPTHNSIIVTKNPYLQVLSTSPTSGDLNYKIEMSANDFESVIVYLSENGGSWSKTAYASGETACLTIPETDSLISGNTYTWRAFAFDKDNNNWSLVTDNYLFVVQTPPLIPVIISPIDNYSSPNSQICFQFKAESESGNTLNGRLLISDDQFSTILHNFDQTQTQTGWSETYYYSNSIMAFSIPDSMEFERGKTYWWQVLATDGISWGPLSETRTFLLSNLLKISSVKTFPNPAVSTNQLHIYISATVDANVVIRFFNKLGKEVDQYQGSISGGEQGTVINYDISNYASGIYYYIMETHSAYGTQKIKKRFAIVK